MTTRINYPLIEADQIGWLSEVEMVEVDRVMIEDLHIELVQMMENAGRNLARLVIDRFSPATATVLAGSGGNGGGGLVAARHLANQGVEVRVTTTRPSPQLSGVPAHQFDIVERMSSSGQSVSIEVEPARSDVCIDALVGYSLRGAPSGRVADLIDQVPTLAESVVALDTPSGVSVTDGSVPGAAVVADATLTLALPKLGLRSSPNVGDLFVGDISVPPQVYQAFGITDVPDFALGAIHQIV